MTTMRTSMIIDLAGNLAGKASQFLGSLQRLGSGGSRSMQMLERSASAASRGLDRLGNRYTALVSGAAGVGALKMTGDLSERLAYLGIQAQKPRQEIDRLYSSILNVAQNKDIRVNPMGILAGVETIVEKLGDMQLAQDNLENIGYLIRATGAEGKDAGDIIANLREKFDIKSPKEMREALAILTVQGKEGAFTLRDMVTQGNRVTAAYGSMGRKGMGAVREMGAILQVMRKSTGVPEEASTAFKNFFNDLMEPKHQKILEANGIQIWDPAKLQQGKKQIRSAVDIIDEILTKANGDPDKLSRLFGMQAMDGMKAFISTWQSSGKNAADQFMQVQVDGRELMADSATMAREYNAAITNIYTSWQRFASGNLMGPVQSLADKLNSLQPATVDRWLKLGTGLAAILGGAIVINQVAGAVKNVGGLFGKGKGGAAGGLGAGTPIPVYVVNKHLSMLPGKGWGFPGGEIPGLPGKAGGALGRLLKSGAVVAGGKVVLAGAAGYGVGTLIERKFIKGAIGDWFYDFMHKQPASQKKAEVGGEIRIRFDDAGRPRVAAMSSINSRVPLSVDSGLMMAGH